MLFAVRMQVSIPYDLDPDVRADLLAREKAYCQDLQRAGKWPQIWRLAGQYANLSVFDVEGPDELNEIMFGLPLFPFMAVEVMPLARHFSDIKPAT